MKFSFLSVITENWKGIAKALAIVILLAVGWHYASGLFEKQTVTVYRTVEDTTRIAALTQQLQMKDAQIEADTLALAQFEAMVNDAQTSKDSAVAFYRKVIADLQASDTTHIIIPSATASKVFTSTVAGQEYQDTVKVTYHFPPLNSFDVDLMLAARIVITSHQEASTITTIRPKFELWAGPTFVDESIFATANAQIGNWEFEAGYRLGTLNYTPGDGPLANVLFGVKYRLFQF